MLLSTIINQFRTVSSASLRRKIFCQVTVKALEAMARCRHEHGPHMLARCSNHQCGAQAYIPHSCGHRNCPHCQNHESQRWIEQQISKKRLTVHVLSDYLYPASTTSRSGLEEPEYRLLPTFATVQELLKSFTKNDKNLGGEPGSTTILPYPDQKPRLPSHIHVVMPGASINLKTSLWKVKSPGYLFSHKALAKVFRAKGRHHQRHRGRTAPGCAAQWQAGGGFRDRAQQGRGRNRRGRRHARRAGQVARRSPGHCRHRGLQLRRPGDRRSSTAAWPCCWKAPRLAIIVVWLFLRDWRATLVAATALPLSVIPAFGVMYLMGFTLNMVTLLCLSLVVGILVDDAIVEIENIMRHLRMGKTPYQAAMEAADEIGLAVIATTFTLIAVFLPTAFMARRAGQVLRPVRLDGGDRRVLQPGGGAHADAHDGGLHPESRRRRTSEPPWMIRYPSWAALVPESPHPDAGGHGRLHRRLVHAGAPPAHRLHPAR